MFIVVPRPFFKAEPSNLKFSTIGALNTQININPGFRDNHQYLVLTIFSSQFRLRECEAHFILVPDGHMLLSQTNLVFICF